MASIGGAIAATQRQISNPFRRAYFTFGYMPLLLVLDQYEKLEYYMTCHLIKTALLEALEGEKIPTRYGSDALNATVQDFNKRGWGDQVQNYMNNVPNYAVECRKFIEANYPTCTY